MSTDVDDFSDSLPILGHVNSLIHFAKGDKEGGKRIMAKATRWTAVCFCSDPEVFGGWVSVATGAAIGGLLADVALSIIRVKPYGVMKGAEYTVSDVKKGQFPVAGLAYTVLGLLSYACFGIGFLVARELTCLKDAAVKGIIEFVTQEGIIVIKNIIGALICEICKTKIVKDTNAVWQFLLYCGNCIWYIWQFFITCGELVMGEYSRMFGILF